MNNGEALLLSGNDDIESTYLEKLFVLKQGILRGVPFTKLYEPRKRKIEDLNAAYIALGGRFEQAVTTTEEMNDAESVSGHYNEFFRIRNLFFRQISATGSGPELIRLMNDYLKLYGAYASKWEVETEFDETGIIISMEPDPMELLAAIREQEMKESLSFEKLRKGMAEEIVLKEAKRLTLWLKFEGRHGELR